MTTGSSNKKKERVQSPKKREQGGVKKLKTVDANKITTNDYDRLKDEPLIIKNGIEHEIQEKLSWKSIKKSVPNIMIEVVESLASSSENEKIEKQSYHCKLHEYIDYCKGKRITFLIQTGKFDIKPKNLDLNEKKLYLLGLNCNKNPELERHVKINKCFGDWFEKYLPNYTREIVYDKGHTWFFIGPELTISELHSDHNHVHTTLQQCDGTKEVFLVEPDKTQELINKFGNKIQFINRENQIFLINGANKPLKIEEGSNMMYSKIETGDTLYIPSNWGHMVRSLTKSITVSRDFIDERNIDAYITSIVKKKLQKK